MVASELTASAKAMGPIPSDGGQQTALPLQPLTNRADQSSSAFVRSLANSLVAWQPLDDATIERARREHKLIYMHIGYRACHHCRLMAHDSFANNQCASIINDSFIPVAIDRDERPDLDAIYMNYVQALANIGGWPLNVFLTPNLEPVFGGTYWPCANSSPLTTDDSEEEVLGFMAIVKKVRDIWRDQESRCRKEATEMVAQLRNFAAEGTLNGTRNFTPGAASSQQAAQATTAQEATSTQAKTASEVDLDQLEDAYSHIAGTYDPVYGGFGLAPKFVTPPKLAFLMSLPNLPGPAKDVIGHAECENGLQMALATLRKVRDGALRDHVGGTGFSRFSLTPDWTVPNFEKLTSDNALLLSLYTDAWKQGGKANDEFRDIVIELADYLTTAPIALPNGAFATSEAADSYQKKGDQEMREGAYHTWTRKEFDREVEALDKQAAQIAAAYFGIREDGNVEQHHDPNDEFINQNTLSVRRSLDELSRQFGVSVERVEDCIHFAKTALSKKQQQDRVRPEIDDQVVVGTVGLVIAALARAEDALDEPKGVYPYQKKCSDAVDFILREKLWDPVSQTLHRTWSGQRGGEGFADDYAYLIKGLLQLWHSTKEDSLLMFADQLQKAQIAKFYDPAGGFYTTVADAPHTILRLKDGLDTTLPSTNAVSVENLFQLGHILADDKYVSLAHDTINAFEAEMLQHPWLFPGLLGGVVKARLPEIKEPPSTRYRLLRAKA